LDGEVGIAGTEIPQSSRSGSVSSSSSSSAQFKADDEDEEEIEEIELEVGIVAEDVESRGEVWRGFTEVSGAVE